jgi:hypothetical protein
MYIKCGLQAGRVRTLVDPKVEYFDRTLSLKDSENLFNCPLIDCPVPTYTRKNLGIASFPGEPARPIAGLFLGASLSESLLRLDTRTSTLSRLLR